MKITQVQQFMLFVLGRYYKKINHKHKTPFLKVALSKVEFIDSIRKSGFVKKQPRAIYRNLEDLEKNKFIRYEHQLLKFTPKGKKEFDKINKEISVYIDVVEIIKNKDFYKSKFGGQMIFFSEGQPKID